MGLTDLPMAPPLGELASGARLRGLFQIPQYPRPEGLLLPHGDEAAVEVHLIHRRDDGAPQQPLFVVGVGVEVADGGAGPEDEGQAVLHLVAEGVVGLGGGAVGALHPEQHLDVFQREDVLGQHDVEESGQLLAGILLFDGVGDDSFLDIIAHHRGGKLHPGEAPEAAVDQLYGLVEIEAHGGQLPVAREAEAGGAGRDTSFHFLIHAGSIAHFRLRVNRL